MDHFPPMLTWQKIVLKLRNPFRLSYGTSETREAYWIRLHRDEGWGEGTIPPYYQISSLAMESYWERISKRNILLPDTVDDIAEWIDPTGPAPARCGLEIALYDRIARKQNQPLYQTLGLKRPEAKPSSFTIAVDTVIAMTEIALKVNHFPIIKVKLAGDTLDIERLAAVRKACPDAILLVDANAGWKFDQAITYLDDLMKFDVALLEQPLEAADIAGMGRLQKETNIPIVADESVQSIYDIERLANVGVRGVNIKLMKVGGIGPALEMIKKAADFDMQIMLGCMIETSIGTTAMAHLSGLAQWLDLDASMLISNDPFTGMHFDEHAVVSVSDQPGIGVSLKT